MEIKEHISDSLISFFFCSCISLLFPFFFFLGVFALSSTLASPVLCSLSLVLCAAVLFAPCSVLCALFALLSALCSLLCALCSLLRALCSVLFVARSVLRVLCFVPCALCSVLSLNFLAKAIKLGELSSEASRAGIHAAAAAAAA